MSETLQELAVRHENQEELEYKQALADIQSLLMTKPGQRFVRYIFKHFEVGELPPIGMSGDLLMDKLGSLRPGREFFNLISAADTQMAGMILSGLQKEKFEKEKYENMVQTSLQRSK